MEKNKGFEMECGKEMEQGNGLETKEEIGMEQGAAKEKETMKIKAIREFVARPDMFEIVDFLNKSLKDTNLIFGLKKDGDRMTITIYEE